MKSLLQSDFWANFKAKYGWRPLHLFSPRLLVLSQKTPFGSLLYLPEVSQSQLSLRSASLTRLSRQLRVLGKKERSVMVRLELLIPYSADRAALLLAQGFRKGHETQPEWRQVIDLRLPISKIESGISSKTRYNLGLAEKKNLTVHWGRAKLVPELFALYQRAADRSRFAARSQSYFYDLLDSIPHTEIIVISHLNHPVAAALISSFDKRVSYLYGGLDYSARALMAPILLHIEVMRRAKRQGNEWYDLLAVGPAYPGLTRFKAQFGGETIRYLGSWDIPVKPVGYWLFRLGEWLRRR